MNMPWMKFAHVEFLLSPDMLGLSLQSQGALLRLMAHAARQTPYGSLPDDFDLIGRMVGKGWNKRIQQELFNGVFVANEDGRWTCPLMTEVWSDAPKANNDVTVEVTTAHKAKTNAQRQAEYKARRKGNVTSNTENEIGNAKSNEGNATGNAENVTFGGIKGGDLDLDQDLDLDLEKNKKTKTAFFEKTESAIEKPQPAFDPDDLPNLEQLNYQLKAGGAEPVTIDFVKSQLFEFQARFSSQHLSHFEKMGKWLAWCKRNQEKAKTDAARLQRMASSGQNSGQNSGKGGFVDYANTGARQTETPAPIAHIAALSGIELMAFKRLKMAFPDVTEHGIAAQAKAENVDLLVLMNRKLAQAGAV